MTIVKTQPVDGVAAGFAVAGGNIIVENATTPTLRTGGWGLGFGPLRIAPFAGTTVRIDELSFAALESSFWPFLSAASGVTNQQTATAGAGAALLAASAPDEEIALTRRDALVAAGVAATTALATGTAAADDDDDDDTDEATRHVAEFELSENPRGIGIWIDDMVADYLPHGQTYYAEVDGSTVDSFETGNGESLVIGPKIEGTLRIISESEASLVQRILVQIQRGEEIKYTFQLDEQLDETPRGETVLITDQPIVIDAIESAGSSETLIEIGGENIPHTDEGSSTRGNWYIRDEVSLVVETDVDSPDSQQVELTINAGLLDSLLTRLN